MSKELVTALDAYLDARDRWKSITEGIGPPGREAREEAYAACTEARESLVAMFDKLAKDPKEKK